MKLSTSGIIVLSCIFVYIDIITTVNGELIKYCTHPKAYILMMDAKVSYQQALQNCRAHGYGYELASITSRDDNNCISDLITETNNDKHHFWTCGNDAKQQETYIWQSYGEVAYFTNWYPGQPTHTADFDGKTQHCISVLKTKEGDLKWVDSYSYDEFFYICERRFDNY